MSWNAGHELLQIATISIKGVFTFSLTFKISQTSTHL